MKVWEGKQVIGFLLTWRLLRHQLQQQMKDKYIVSSCYINVGIQDFPEGWVPTPKVGVLTCYFANFLPKTAWKWKNWYPTMKWAFHKPFMAYFFIVIVRIG